MLKNKKEREEYILDNDNWDKGWNMALMDAIDTISNLEMVEVKGASELTDDEIVILKNIAAYYD